MNYSKKIMSILALCMICSLSAKRAGGGQKAVAQPQQPAPITKINQPVQKQPVQQKESYKDLVALVRNASNAWDNSRSMLRADFVNTIAEKARAAQLDNFQLESLLQTARDMHGIFSGNRNKDIAILQSIDNQIAAAIR